MKNLTHEWLVKNVRLKGLTQTELGKILGMSQSAARKKLTGETTLNHDDIERLEKYFNQSSPMRQPVIVDESFKIAPDVLDKVLIHIGTNYSNIIGVDPYEFSKEVIALCRYVQSGDRANISKAESDLALFRILEEG